VERDYPKIPAVVLTAHQSPYQESVTPKCMGFNEIRQSRHTLRRSISSSSCCCCCCRSRGSGNGGPAAVVAFVHGVDVYRNLPNDVQTTTTNNRWEKGGEGTSTSNRGLLMTEVTLCVWPMVCEHEQRNCEINGVNREGLVEDVYTSTRLPYTTKAHSSLANLHDHKTFIYCQIFL